MDKTLFSRFLQIKKKSGVSFVDTHVHPIDVLGLAHHYEPSTNDGYSKRIQNPTISLLEHLKFNDFALFILRFVFKFLPFYATSSVRDSYSNSSERELLNRLNSSGIDKAVLIPIEPLVSQDQISQSFKNEKFIKLGSIDLDKTSLGGIEEEMDRQIREFNIVGLKLHPNFQSFYPIPEMNERKLSEKLTQLYSVINKKKLYVLFHAGLSYVPGPKKSFIKKDFALLENFCKDDVSILDLLKVPVVIAHMGVYNVSSADVATQTKMLQKYNHLYFDTTAVNSDLIAKFIKTNGSQAIDRLVFGSDALYFDIKNSLLLVLLALGATLPVSEFETSVVKIFGSNYLDMLKRCQSSSLL